MNQKYNIQLKALCRKLNLGEIVSEPTPLTGGLMHKMFALETIHCKYAIKAINPQIILRSTAMKNYVNSELIASLASKNIAALPAKVFGGKAVQELSGQCYLVFDWVNGKSRSNREVNQSECEKIGNILGDLHRTDFSSLGLIDDSVNEEPPVDWNFYLKKGEETHAVWVDVLRKNLDCLYRWDDEFNKATKKLAANTVISHRDLDPKNVLWVGNHPTIIDWEAAGFIHPMHDLVETAIYWSGDENNRIDKERFSAFILGYQKSHKLIQTDWQMVLGKGLGSKLGWLEYSLKRSLWIECSDSAEQQLGVEHVLETIHELIAYADNISELQLWLNQFV